MTSTLIVKEENGAKTYEFNTMADLSNELKNIFQASSCPSEITMIDHSETGDMIVRVGYDE